MRSDSVKNMSAYADQNHAPSLAAARLEQSASDFETHVVHTPQNLSAAGQKPIAKNKCLKGFKITFFSQHLILLFLH